MYGTHGSGFWDVLALKYGNWLVLVINREWFVQCVLELGMLFR